MVTSSNFSQLIISVTNTFNYSLECSIDRNMFAVTQISKKKCFSIEKCLVSLESTLLNIIFPFLV